MGDGVYAGAFADARWQLQRRIKEGFGFFSFLFFFLSSQLLINKRNTFRNALQVETLQRQITTCLTCDKVFQVSVYIHMYFPPETPGSGNERFLLAMYVY